MNKEALQVFKSLGIPVEDMLNDLASAPGLPDVPFEKRVEGVVVLFTGVANAIDELRKAAIALLRADPVKGSLVPEDYDPPFLCPTVTAMVVEVFEHVTEEVGEIASGEGWFVE